MIAFTITCFLALLLTLAALVDTGLRTPNEIRYVVMTCAARFFALACLAIVYGWGRTVGLWL